MKIFISSLDPKSLLGVIKIWSIFFKLISLEHFMIKFKILSCLDTNFLYQNKKELRFEKLTKEYDESRDKKIKLMFDLLIEKNFRIH